MNDERVEIGEIAASELKRRLERGESPIILDVRETGEVEIAPFPGAIHMPMGDVPSRIGELDPERETVVVCHHGIRSARVAVYLAQRGFERILNLSGGIDAWSTTVDAGVPRY